MKLVNLIELYDETLDSINQKWDELINAVINNKTIHQYQDEEFSTFALFLTVGEFLLSNIIKKYNEIEDMLFYINDAKNKVNIPELGVSISYAESQMEILKHNLFNHQKLGQIVSETGFEIVGQDEENNLNVKIKDIRKGFNVDAIDNSILFLEHEIEKYQSYIDKTIASVEIVVPFLENNNKQEFLGLDFQSKIGTSKKQIDVLEPTTKEEVDLLEYQNAEDFIKNEENNFEENKSCPICNSIYRNNIETFYKDTNNNILETLQFAANDSGLTLITPNVLLNHLEYHGNIIPKNLYDKNTLIHEPDNHVFHEHSGNYYNSKGDKPIKQKDKMKNIAPTSYNPNTHNIRDHMS